MSYIAEDDRTAARCNDCGNIYTVNIRPDGNLKPIGVPPCGDCGGIEFTAFGERGQEIVPTDE